MFDTYGIDWKHAKSRNRAACLLRSCFVSVAFTGFASCYFFRLLTAFTQGIHPLTTFVNPQQSLLMDKPQCVYEYVDIIAIPDDLKVRKKSFLFTNILLQCQQCHLPAVNPLIHTLPDCLSLFCSACVTGVSVCPCCKESELHFCFHSFYCGLKNSHRKTSSSWSKETRGT